MWFRERFRERNPQDLFLKSGLGRGEGDCRITLYNRTFRDDESDLCGCSSVHATRVAVKHLKVTSVMEELSFKFYLILID